MRFVWAVVAFILATVLIGAGIAQRTIFMGPSEQRMELSVEQPTPYVLVDAKVLRAHVGLQTLRVRGKGDIFVAYGRTDDMKAWLSDTAYESVSLAKSGKPKTTRVVAQQPPAGGGETSGRSPEGSDLWLDSFADQDSLVAAMQLTGGNSVLIARDGVEPAPTEIMVSWPLDARTPWAGPLMVAGGALLAVGIVLYILGIRHQRRGRGPRRKGPGPLPATQPITMPEHAELTKSGNAAQGRAQHRSAATRRLSVAVPALALTGLLAAGCTSDSWPQFDSESPSPTPTPTVVKPDNQKPAVVGEKQGQRIVSDIATTLAKADADFDASLAETRLTGIPLAVRKTEYTLRGKIADRDTALLSPTGEVRVLLPEATEGWPRTVLALTADDKDDTEAPVLMTMTQADPWTGYRVTAMAQMPASTAFPNVAPYWLGTTRVPSESAFLSLPPADLAAAFSNFVDAGEKSPYAADFDDVARSTAQGIRDARAKLVQHAIDEKADKTSKIEFKTVPTDDEPMSLATLDSGAVVVVSLNETQTISSTNPDAVIRFGDNKVVTTLTGVTEAAKGYVSSYSTQYFFAVPAQGSNQQIRLLANHENIMSVKVIE